MEYIKMLPKKQVLFFNCNSIIAVKLNTTIRLSVYIFCKIQVQDLEWDIYKSMVSIILFG